MAGVTILLSLNMTSLIILMKHLCGYELDFHSGCQLLIDIIFISRGGDYVVGQKSDVKSHHVHRLYFE